MKKRERKQERKKKDGKRNRAKVGKKEKSQGFELENEFRQSQNSTLDKAHSTWEICEREEEENYRKENFQASSTALCIDSAIHVLQERPFLERKNTENQSIQEKKEN
jgi:hypothetical protein